MQTHGRNLLAYFTDRKQAEKASKALQGSGYEFVSVDRINKYGGDDTQVRQNPATGNITSLAELTLGADVETASEGILLAADPSASGLTTSDGVHEYNWLVTVVTEEDRVNRAVSLLEDNGGRL